MSQAGAGKTKIYFDSTDLANSDQIGAHAMAGGVAIAATGTSMNVAVTSSVLPSGAATEATLASILSLLQGLDYADGSVWSAGSMGIEALAVRQDATGPLTGVDDGDFSPLQVDANGLLKVSATVNFAGDYAEDTAHVSGDVGLFSLSVRNDAQATTLTSGTGDYAPFATNPKGAMYVKDISNGGNLQQVVSVDDTVGANPLPATPLTNRSSMMIQMLDAGALYLGSATVDNAGAARGFLLNKGGFVSLDVGPANLIYGISDSAGGRDVIVWEFAE